MKRKPTPMGPRGSYETHWCVLVSQQRGGRHTGKLVLTDAGVRFKAGQWLRGLLACAGPHASTNPAAPSAVEGGAAVGGSAS
jgi:hypothetical protein